MRLDVMEQLETVLDEPMLIRLGWHFWDWMPDDGQWGWTFSRTHAHFYDPTDIKWDWPRNHPENY